MDLMDIRPFASRPLANLKWANLWPRDHPTGMASWAEREDQLRVLARSAADAFPPPAAWAGHRRHEGGHALGRGSCAAALAHDEARAALVGIVVRFALRGCGAGDQLLRRQPDERVAFRSATEFTG
jgi:hypothetical protein